MKLIPQATKGLETIICVDGIPCETEKIYSRDIEDFRHTAAILARKAKVRGKYDGIIFVSRSLLCFLCFLLCASALAQSDYPIALNLDRQKRTTQPLDLNTTNVPTFVRGDDVELDITLFSSGSLLSTNQIKRFTNLTVQIFGAQNDTNQPQMAQTIYSTNFFTNLTTSGFATNNYPSNYQIEAYWPGSASSLFLNGAASEYFWLRVFTTDTNGVITTFGEGPIQVEDGPISALTPALSIYTEYLTVSNLSLALAPPFANFFSSNAAAINAVVTGNNVNGTGITNLIATNGINGSNYTLTLSSGLGTSITNFFQWGSPLLSNEVTAFSSIAWGPGSANFGFGGTPLVDSATVPGVSLPTSAFVGGANLFGLTSAGVFITVLSTNGLTNSAKTPFYLASKNTLMGLGVTNYYASLFGTGGGVSFPNFASDSSAIQSDGLGDLLLGYGSNGVVTGGSIQIERSATNSRVGAVVVQGQGGNPSFYANIVGTDDAFVATGTNYQTGPADVFDVNGGSGEMTAAYERHLWTVQQTNYQMSLYDNYVLYVGTANATNTLPLRLTGNSADGFLGWVNPNNLISPSNSFDTWVFNHSASGSLIIGDTNADHILCGNVSATNLTIPPAGWVHLWSEGTNIIADGEHVILPGTYTTASTNGLKIVIDVNAGSVTNPLNAQLISYGLALSNAISAVAAGTFNGTAETNFIIATSNALAAFTLSQSQAALSLAQVFATNLSQSGTNFTVTTSNSLASYAQSQAAAATSAAETFTQSIGTTITNFVNATVPGSFNGLTLTNQLNAASNLLYSLAFTIGANGTNFAQGTIGLNATNFTLAVSNSLVSYANSLGSAYTNFAQSLGTTMSNSFQFKSANLSNINSDISASGANISLLGNLAVPAGGISANGFTNMLLPVWLTNGPGTGGPQFVVTNSGGNTVIASNRLAMAGTNAASILLDQSGNITASGTITTTGGLTSTAAINQTSTSGPNIFSAGVNVNNSLAVTGTATFTGTVNLPLGTLIPSGSGNTTTLDWSTGFSQSNYLAGGATYTMINLTDRQQFTVSVTDSGGHLVTWSVPAGQNLKWSGGSAPAQTANKTDVYTFIKIGTTIYGSAVQNF